MHTIKCIRLLVFGALLIGVAILGLPAFAQEEPPVENAPFDVAPFDVAQFENADEQSGDDEGEGYETTVTVSREEQPVFETDRTIQSVDREELARLAPRSLPDALKETTGVLVQETNRGAGAPFIRGLVGPQNLILVDGIRFNNSTFRTGPNQYLSMVDPSSIDRVEVLLGPGSVLYGSDAMGGVINIIPLGWSGVSGVGGRVGARFASPDLSTSGWADGWWASEDASVLLGGSFRNFGTLTAGGGGDQPISDYQQGSWRLRSEVELGGDSSLGLTYLGSSILDAGREDRLYEGSYRFYDNDDHLGYLEWRYRPNGLLRELRVAASLHRTHEEVERFRCNLVDLPQSGDVDGCLEAGVGVREAGRSAAIQAPLTRHSLSEDTVWTPGMLASASFGFWNNRIRLVTGVESYRDSVSSSSEERRGDGQPAWTWVESDRGNFSDGSTYWSLGGWANVEGDLFMNGTHAVVLGTGARVSRFSASASEVPGLGDVEYEHTGAVATAGLRYLLGMDFMVYVNGSQGFRTPNLQESTVLGDTGSKFELPNDELVPELSNTLEAGLRLEHWPVRLHLAGFLSDIEHVIDERELTEAEWQELDIDQSEVGDRPVVQRVNSMTARYIGTEATLELGDFFGLTPWGRVSWIEGEIENDAGESYPARRVPPLLGSTGLRYEHPDDSFYAELFIRFAGEQDRLHPSDESDLRICEDPETRGDTFSDNGRDCSGTESWVDLNLRGGYRFDDVFRADLSINNLLDELYHYHGSGIDAPGFGATLSVGGEF